MKTISAKDAKNGFGLLLDTARAEPVTIEKHGRAVAVVLSVEQYAKLKGREPGNKSRAQASEIVRQRKARQQPGDERRKR